MSDERTSRIRPLLVKKLKKQCGKSLSLIAKESHIHVGTLKRWLAGEKAFIDNISLLAKALNTTADKITLPDGEEDLTDYVNAEIIVPENQSISGENKDLFITLRFGSSDLKQDPSRLRELVKMLIDHLHSTIGAKHPIVNLYIGSGSLRIGIKLHTSDARRLASAYLRKQLASYQIISITFISDDDEVDSQEVPDYLKLPNPRLTDTGFAADT
jgi:transcriptional regulator with XRE-family HTH domain